MQHKETHKTIEDIVEEFWDVTHPDGSSTLHKLIGDCLSDEWHDIINDYLLTTLHSYTKQREEAVREECINIVESLRQKEPSEERLKDDPYLAEQYQEYKDDIIGHNIVINKVKKALSPKDKDV